MTVANAGVTLAITKAGTIKVGMSVMDKNIAMCANVALVMVVETTMAMHVVHLAILALSPAVEQHSLPK